jgi:hypothetical protein
VLWDLHRGEGAVRMGIHGGRSGSRTGEAALIYGVDKSHGSAGEMQGRVEALL